MVKANTTPTMVVAKIKELLGMEVTPKESAEKAAKGEPDANNDEVVAEKLERYKKLLDEGVITQQEFDEIKKKLMFE